MSRVARQRRHTLHFLRYARAQAPVFLSTEVDMTEVMRHRAMAREAGVRYAVPSYVLKGLTTVLDRHPDANAALGSGWAPKLARFAEIRPKVALDKEVDGVRVVLSAVLPDLRGTGLDEIQEHLTRLRDTPAAELPEVAGALKLHRLPARLGWLAFRLVTGNVARRAEVMGTVALSSLGRSPIEEFHATGGTALTVNIGQVRDRAVVRGGEVVAAPTLKVNLCFDHRVLDGAHAADVLTELKDELEATWVRPSQTQPIRLVAEGSTPS